MGGWRIVPEDSFEGVLSGVDNEDRRGRLLIELCANHRVGRCGECHRVPENHGYLA
jgi:hypothetical protein